MVSVLLILAGLGIISDAGISLFSHDNPKPKIWALPIAALSMLINEILYYYTNQVGKKINSLLLIANAWHHRSDSWASLVVLLGIFGSLLGVYWLDAAAAVVVGLMIANMGRQYALQSIRELVDTAIPETQLSDIKRLILNIDGVVKIHQLRTRSMGNDIYIDVHVMVNPFISVSEGHYIAQNVHHRLMNNHPEIKDVTVHIDPEDDEETTAASEINPLPSRKMLEHTWLNTWQKEFPEITTWNVHYLENAITLDLFLADHFKRWETLYTKTNHDIAQASHRTNIRYYHIQSKGKLH
jgi:cation diffusion facilitator family transporter